MSEKFFSWSKSLEVGNQLIDDEHQEIIRRMGRLYDLNHNIYDKHLLVMGMEELLHFTRQHFRDEEKLMLLIGYPGLEQHRHIHELLLQTLERYAHELATSVYNRFPSSVFDFMKTWITTHIIIVDQQYAEYLRSRPQKVS